MTVQHSTRIDAGTPYGADLTSRSRVINLERLGADPTISDDAREAVLGQHEGMPGSIVLRPEVVVTLESNATRDPDVVGVLTAYPEWADGTLPKPSLGYAGDHDELGALSDGLRSSGPVLAVAASPYESVWNADASPSGPDGGGWGAVGGTLTYLGDADSPHPTGRAFRITPGEYTGFVYCDSTPTAYRLRPDRDFTVTGYLAVPGGGSVQVRLGIAFLDSDDAPITTYLTPWQTVDVEAGTWQRVAGRTTIGELTPVELPASQAYYLEWRGTLAFDLAAPEMYAGQDRGPLQGLAVVIPSHGGVAFSETFFPAQYVNRIELYGSDEFGQITSARAETSDAAELLGIAAGPGPLSITHEARLTDTTRVVVEEAVMLGTGHIFASEVDFLRVEDVSERVISWDLSESRESTPDGSTIPIGNFTAKTFTVTLADLDGLLSPVRNEAITSQHRLEVATHVQWADSDGNAVREAIPDGVFFSLDGGWSRTPDGVVTIEATDVLGRFSSIDLADTVTEDVLVSDVVRALALEHLDMGGNEVVVTGPAETYAIPYAFPTGTLGTYLADLAKAVMSVLWIDRYGRLRLAGREDIAAEVSATLTDANAIISTSVPLGDSTIRTVLQVTATPLALGARAVLYELASEAAVTIPPGVTARIFVPFESTVALEVQVDSYTATGTVDVYVHAYSTLADVFIENTGATTSVLSALVLSGLPLTESPLSVQVTSEKGIRQFGRRVEEITARLVQTYAQLQTIADSLLAAFAGIDPVTSRRALPDVEIDSLGLALAELGDRVAVQSARAGVGSDFYLVRHERAYNGTLTSRTLCRRADIGFGWFHLDSSTLDGPDVLPY